MAVERLVQEHGVDRSRILIAAAGPENSAGEEQAGSDAAAGEPTPEGREDASLNGAITVRVEFDDETSSGKVRAAFAEFDASSVEEE